MLLEEQELTMKLFWAVMLFCSFLFPADLAAKQINISASVFPIWLLVRKITENVPGVQGSLILPAGTGCPHDYAPTPQDRKKLAGCDVLVINGLGLESFLGGEEEIKSILKKDAIVIDASAGCSGLLGSEDNDNHMAHLHDKSLHDVNTQQSNDTHHNTPINPHIFASPYMLGQMAESVARQLAAADPENGESYLQNARSYRSELNSLAEELRLAFPDDGKKHALVQHDIFSYLTRDMGIEIDGVIQKHEGIEPSARELLELVRLIRTRKTSLIITEPQYPARNGEMLSRETGIPCICLDPVASGPDNAPPDYYSRTMRRNLQILRQTFGNNQ